MGTEYTTQFETRATRSLVPSLYIQHIGFTWRNLYALPTPGLRGLVLGFFTLQHAPPASGSEPRLGEEGRVYMARLLMIAKTKTFRIQDLAVSLLPFLLSYRVLRDI